MGLYKTPEEGLIAQILKMIAYFCDVGYVVKTNHLILYYIKTVLSLHFLDNASVSQLWTLYNTFIACSIVILYVSFLNKVIR